MASPFAGCIPTSSSTDQLSTRLIAVGSLDGQQLSLVANAFAKEEHVDRSLLCHLSRQAERPEVVDALNAHSLALFLNALAQNADDEIKVPAALIRKAPEIDMDITSLSLVLNSLARLKQFDKDSIDLLAQQVEEKMHMATPRQVGMIFNAVPKLHMYHPTLIDSLVVRMRRVRTKLDAQSLVLVCNAAAKLRLSPEIFQDLYDTVPRLLGSMKASQLSVLSHAWAKAHVYNDDLYELLKMQLERLMKDVDVQALALTAYGFAHFRKDFPKGLTERLLEHLDGEVPDIYLFMIVNAYSRLGIVNEKLKAVLIQADAKEHLSPKAQSLYVT